MDGGDRPPVMSAWMEKKGRMFKTWRRRWFILRHSPPTLEYRQRKDSKPKGVIELGPGTVAAVSSVAPSGFELACPGPAPRLLYVNCENSSRAAAWIDAINSVVSSASGRPSTAGSDSDDDGDVGDVARLTKALSVRAGDGFAGLPPLQTIKERDRASRRSFDGQAPLRPTLMGTTRRAVSSLALGGAPARRSSAGVVFSSAAGGAAGGAGDPPA